RRGGPAERTPGTSRAPCARACVSAAGRRRRSSDLRAAEREERLLERRTRVCARDDTHARGRERHDRGAEGDVLLEREQVVPVAGVPKRRKLVDARRRRRVGLERDEVLAPLCEELQLRDRAAEALAPAVE